MKSCFMVSLFTVFLVVQLVSSIGGVLASPSETAQVQVRIEIPALHHMDIVEDVSVSFSPTELEAGESLVFRDVGHLAVRSNGDWMVTVGSYAFEGVEVYLKPSSGTEGDWQRVDGEQGMFSGVRGTHAVRWDVELRLDSGYREDSILFDGKETKTIGFSFTISST